MDLRKFKRMKKSLLSFLPTLALPAFFCMLLCGAFLVFLVSSGALLMFSNESRNKTFLIPLLLLAAFLLWLRYYYNKCCVREGSKSFSDHILVLLLYLAFSVLVGFLFVVYIFIPWWIPGYQGGLLLP